MFKIGDKVVDKGCKVYEVSSIEDKDFGNGNEKYLLLKPCFRYEFSQGYIGYVPQSRADELLRNIVGKKEAQQMVESFDTLQSDENQQPKDKRNYYYGTIKSGSLLQLLKAYKTLLLTKKERDSVSRKISEFEKTMIKTISVLLLSELSIALEEDESEIEKKLLEKIDYTL